MTAPPATDPLRAWREQLEAWAIPEEILAAVPDSPWELPVGLFRRRADQARERAPTPSDREAARWLPPGGTVLDVGAGGGAASLPLAGGGSGGLESEAGTQAAGGHAKPSGSPPVNKANRLVAVDESAGMLEAFRTATRQAQVAAETVLGHWPEVADRVGAADVVVCYDVLYNVQDLEPFARALTAHARHRVVAQLGERHPLVEEAPLWRTFHHLDRPDGPTADDAEAALRALGLVVERQDWTAGPRASFATFDDLVAFLRRRLCLPREREAELAAVLAADVVEDEHGVRLRRGPRHAVTLSWPGAA
ncbi:MAG TPA: methyltransferase domain-containing protein [Actinomycetes bacterium]